LDSSRWKRLTKPFCDYDLVHLGSFTGRGEFHTLLEIRITSPCCDTSAKYASVFNRKLGGRKVFALCHRGERARGDRDSDCPAGNAAYEDRQKVAQEMVCLENLRDDLILQIQMPEGYIEFEGIIRDHAEDLAGIARRACEREESRLKLINNIIFRHARTNLQNKGNKRLKTQAEVLLDRI